MNMRGFDKEAVSWDEFPARVKLAVAGKLPWTFCCKDEDSFLSVESELNEDAPDLYHSVWL